MTNALRPYNDLQDPVNVVPVSFVDDKLLLLVFQSYLRQGSSYLLGHYFTLVGSYVWRIFLIRSTLSQRLCLKVQQQK